MDKDIMRGTIDMKDLRQQKNKPSSKQLYFAAELAKRHGIDIPLKALENKKECSAFIDRYKDHGTPPAEPSEKMIRLAKLIEKQTGAKIPENCMTDRKAMSLWLNQNQGKVPDSEPYKGTIFKAEQIADALNLTLPKECYTSYNAIRRFIREHEDAALLKGYKP